MGKYKEIVYHLPQKKEVMEKLTIITDAFVENVKVTHPQKYNNFIEEVKTLCGTYHFNAESIKEVEEYFDKYITVEDTSKLAKEKFEIDFTEEPFNKYDFNFIINDHYKIYGHHLDDDLCKVGELALTWLDANNGKVKIYFEKVYK